MTTTLAERRKKLLKQLDALKIFSNTATVRKLRQELNAKLHALETKIERGKQAKLPLPKTSVHQNANAARAAKMRKYHNYIRQILNSYPGLKYADIRRQFSERKRGVKTDISDVIWRNPSP